jgi:hypothetical protein
MYLALIVITEELVTHFLKTDSDVIVSKRDTLVKCLDGSSLSLKEGSNVIVASRLLPNKILVEVPPDQKADQTCRYGFIQEPETLSKSEITNLTRQDHRELSWIPSLQEIKGNSSSGLIKTALFSRWEQLTNAVEKLWSTPLNGEILAVKSHSQKPEASKPKTTQLRKKTNLSESKIRNSKGTVSFNKSAKLEVNPKIAKAVEKVAKKMRYAERCQDEFMSADGLGPWGKYIKKELSRKHYTNLLNNEKAFRGFCPGFRTMSTQERKSLWVFIVMSMSHYESSCRPKVQAQGPYGIANGLLQLHAGAENKYLHWDQKRICRRGDSNNPIESIQCTLAMLSGQVKRHNSVFFEGSYWDVLRNSNENDTHAYKIKRAIRMIPGCEVRSLAQESNSRHPSSDLLLKNRSHRQATSASQKAKTL